MTIKPTMPISSYGLVHFSLLMFLLLPSIASPVSSIKQSSPHNRIDPLTFFSSYHGGYNITNSHYWASAGFTGVHGYAMAGIWMVGGLGFGVYLVVKNLRSCCSSASSPVAVRRRSNSYYLVPLSVVLLCTFLTIVISGGVLLVNHNSFVKTKKIERSILRVAKVAQRTIRIVTIAMKDMCHLLNPYNKSANILLSSTSAKLAKKSRMIREVVDKRKHSIDRYIMIWYRVTTGIVSINLVLVIVALFVLLHWRPGFIMIIVLCWLITTFFWIFTGFHFFLNTFAEDTCSAFGEFQQHPGNNSLSRVLPCMDEVHADKIMIEIGSTVYKIIDKVNSKLSNLSGTFGLDDEQEKSLSGIFKICNPFNDAPDYYYNPDDCPKDTIPISDIPNVLGRFTCYGDNLNVSCDIDKNFISKSLYDRVLTLTQTIEELLDVLPDIENLARCSFVKDIFSNVLIEQCRSFKKSFQLLWLLILSLSAIMVILEFAWLAEVYHDKERNFLRCSVIPRCN